MWNVNFSETRCINAVTGFINAKINSHSLLEDDMNTARSVICPINPQFQFCSRNEAFQWGKAVLSDKFAIQFCTTTPDACSDERLWNADSCLKDLDELNAFYLRPTSRFQLMEHIENSLQPKLGNGMDITSWKKEVFYIIELAMPAVIANSNITEEVCNFIFHK